MASSVSSGGGRHAAARAHHHQHRKRQQQQPGHLSAHSEHELDTAIARIGARSQSLTALQPSIIQPRMARLETLEAKMASIEVSLSSNAIGRRRKSAISPSPRISASVAAANKENTALSQATPTGRPKNTPTNGLTTPTPIIIGGDKVRKLKSEIDAKKMVIKNIKLALDRLDITDNIDVRIRQAELEYQLGREELNLLTVQEELRRIEEEEKEKGRLSESGDQGQGNTGNISQDKSLQTYLIKNGGRAEIIFAKAQWDRQSGPRFGASTGAGPGLLVEWSAEGSSLHRGDRILEINSRTCGQWTREDLSRALATRPSPAELVVLRPLQRREESPPDSHHQVSALRQELDIVRAGAEEARKAKDGLRADNLRLTHRISYLEEQVQDLLDLHQQNTNHNTPRQPATPCVTSVVDLGSGEVKQVYSKHDTRSVASSRSVRSLDLDADYASEPSPALPGRRHRPQPPKKPLRLSLHRRAQSLQSVDASPVPSPAPPHHDTPEPPAPAHRKRTHRGECTQGAIRWTTRTQGNKWC